MALFCTGTICTYQFTLFCTGSITSSNLGWHAATSSKHPSQPLQWTHVGNLGTFWEIASHRLWTLVGEGDPDFHGFMGDKTGWEETWDLGEDLGPWEEKETQIFMVLRETRQAGRKPGTQMFTRVTSMEPEQLWEILPFTFFHTQKHTKCTDLNNTRPSCIMSRKAWRQNLLSLSGET